MTTKRTTAIVLSVVLLFTALSINAYAIPTNTSFSSATVLSSSVGDEITVTGITSGNSQWFCLYANVGDWVYATIYDMGQNDDWDLALYNSSNVQITHHALYGPSIEYIGYRATYSGYYYFKVKAYSVSSSSSSCHFKAVRSNGDSGPLNNDYSRLDAKGYIERYWNDLNPMYDHFGTGYGDCTNYVSQVIHFAGMPMVGNASTRDSIYSWFIEKNVEITNTDQYSATWANANMFTNYWGTNSMGSGNEKAYSCKYYVGQDIVSNFSTIKSSLRVGDVIQVTYNDDTYRYHTLVVYAVYDNDVLLSAHSDDTISESLFYRAAGNPSQMFVIIRVKYGG